MNNFNRVLKYCITACYVLVLHDNVGHALQQDHLIENQISILSEGGKISYISSISMFNPYLFLSIWNI